MNVVQLFVRDRPSLSLMYIRGLWCVDHMSAGGGSAGFIGQFPTREAADAFARQEAVRLDAEYGGAE